MGATCADRRDLGCSDAHCGPAKKVPDGAVLTSDLPVKNRRCGLRARLWSTSALGCDACRRAQAPLDREIVELILMAGF